MSIKLTTEDLITRVTELMDLTAANVMAHNAAAALRKDLESQLRDELANRSGNAAKVRAAKRILKSAMNDSGRTALHYAWIDEQRRQCICDGFRAFRTPQNNFLPLEPRPEDAGNPVQLEKVYPNIASYEECAAPSLADVKAHIAAERADGRTKTGIEYDMGDNMPVVNAHYLVDMLELLPGAKLYLKPDQSRMISPMVFIAEDGSDGLLLPVRSSKQYTAPKPDDTAAKTQRAGMAILAHYNDMRKVDPDYAMDPETFVDLVLKLYSNPAA